ncbi:hypothetical protein CBR_g8239 [Chara braunii]|uniref:Uncharacterized protein n=1 Tax=Chara braunii TaxID=69332 RepID=A0A388KLR2_CHABU|nr:hypothetical protein CBR_g8239 [Chara braunii]|eukprot:GBG70938.1 hypothetical protein CBR_g8239 [Chara braunii]
MTNVAFRLGKVHALGDVLVVLNVTSYDVLLGLPALNALQAVSPSARRQAGCLLDDLLIDIVSHCDESPAPHILLRTLTPYLQWSACLEGGEDNSSYPSHGNYLNPAGIVDLLFVDRTSEEEEEEEAEGDESEDTPEEDEYYSEHSEHESGAISEEEEDDESKEEEAGQVGTQEEDPAATERRRAEIAEGKCTLEQTEGTDLPIPDDPTRDPEPPIEEDERCAAETSSASTRRQRSRSPYPSLRP